MKIYIRIFLLFICSFSLQSSSVTQCYPMMQRRFYSDTSIRHTLLCLISFQLAPKQISPLTVMLSLKRRGRDKGNMLVVRWRMICLTILYEVKLQGKLGVLLNTSTHCTAHHPLSDVSPLSCDTPPIPQLIPYLIFSLFQFHIQENNNLVTQSWHWDGSPSTSGWRG